MRTRSTWSWHIAFVPAYCTSIPIYALIRYQTVHRAESNEGHVKVMLSWNVRLGIGSNRCLLCIHIFIYLFVLLKKIFSLFPVYVILSISIVIFYSISIFSISR